MEHRVHLLSIAIPARVDAGMRILAASGSANSNCAGDLVGRIRARDLRGVATSFRPRLVPAWIAVAPRDLEETRTIV